MAPRYERVLFGKAPLRLALAQVRFPPLLRFGDDTFLAPFQEGVADAFPDYDKQAQANLKLTTTGVETSGDTLWRFTSEDGSRSLVLTQTALTLESRTFIEIEEFSLQLAGVLETAKKTLGPRERTRLGLRYVNEFHHEKGAAIEFWRSWLNPALVGLPEGILLPGKLQRALQEIHSGSDGERMVVRHGLIQGRIVDPLPSEPERPNSWTYMLDMDCFEDRKTRFDVPATITQARNFNDRMYQFFRWAIEGGDVYEELEPHAP